MDFDAKRTVSRANRPNTPRTQPNFVFTERIAKESRACTSRKATSRFIPELKLPIETMQKIDSISARKKSRSVLELTKTTNFSDAGSIKEYLKTRAQKADEDIAARVIQNAWRRKNRIVKLLKKLSVFMIRRKRCSKYAFHTWRLALPHSAEKLRHDFDERINTMKAEGWIRKFPYRTYWESCFSGVRICTFPQFMKTGMTYVPLDSDVTLTTAFVNIIMRDSLRRCLREWRDVTEESVSVRRAGHRAALAAQMRNNFGVMFTAYVLWRRITKNRKTKNLDAADRVLYEFYVPQWRVYYFMKEAKKERIRTAVCHRKEYLMRASFDYIHSRVMKRKLRANALRGCAHLHGHSVMKTALRAMRYAQCNARMKATKERMILRGWYSVIYQQIKKKERKTIAESRNSLCLLGPYLKMWKNYVLTVKVEHSYLEERILGKNRLLALRAGFLLASDFLNYGVATALYGWKQLHVKKKKGRGFAYWSMHDANKAFLKRYLFDILKENACKKVNRYNYFPFASKADQFLLQAQMAENTPLWAQIRRRRLEKVRNGLGANKFSILLFKASIIDILNAIRRDSKGLCVYPTWVSTATRDQVRDLFFRIVIAVANRSLVNPEVTPDQKLQDVMNYQGTEYLYNAHRIKSKREILEQRSIASRTSLNQMVRRNNSTILQIETHELAIGLSQSNKKFKPSKETKITPIEELNEPETTTSSVFLTEGKSDASRSRKAPTHPMLMPFNTIKQKLDKTEEKYRRKPKGAFSDAGKDSIVTTARSASTKQSTTAAKIPSDHQVTYDVHRPITRSRRAVDMMKGRNFNMHELRSLREKADEIAGPVRSRSKAVEEADFPPGIEDLPSITKTPVSKPIQSSAALSLKMKPYYTESRVSTSAIPAEMFPSNKPPTAPESEDSYDYFEEEEEEEDILDEYDREALRQITNHYVHDEEYIEATPAEKKSLLAEKYLEILPLLLGKRLKRRKAKCNNQPYPDPEKELIETKKLQTRISKILHIMTTQSSFKPTVKATPGQVEMVKRRRRKLERKPLFEDPARKFDQYVDSNGVTYEISNCREFKNCLFIGADHIGMNPWDDDSDNLSDDAFDPSIEHLKTRQLLPGFTNLMKQVGNFLTDNTGSIAEQEYLLSRLSSASSQVTDDDDKAKILRVLDILAHRAITKQAKGEMPSDDEELIIDSKNTSSFETSSSTSSEIQPEFAKKRSVVVKKKSAKKKRKHKAFPADISKTKIPLIVKEQKPTYTQEHIAAIHEGATRAVQKPVKYYGKLSDVKPFEGMEERHKRTVKRISVTDQRPKTALVESKKPQDDGVVLTQGKISLCASPRGKRCKTRVSVLMKDSMVRTDELQASSDNFRYVKFKK